MKPFLSKNALKQRIIYLKTHHANMMWTQKWVHQDKAQMLIQCKATVTSCWDPECGSQGRSLVVPLAAGAALPPCCKIILNTAYCLLQLVCNIMLVLDVQHSDSIFFIDNTPCVTYYKIMAVLPCTLLYSLVACLFYAQLFVSPNLLPPRASLRAQLVKNSPAMQETWI